MIKCEVVTTIIYCEGKEETVYGLEFYRDNEIKPFKTVKDIFVEYNLAKNIKDIINENDIEETHINDIIEDLI